jgi:hypothetical protein
MRPFAVAGLLFVGYALVSLAWAPSINWFAMANLMSLIVAFYLGMVLDEPRKVWIWFIAAMTLLIPIYLFVGVLNHNYAAAAIVMALAIAITYDWYLFIPFAAVGLYFAQSRGALFAAAAVLFVGLFRRFPATAFICAALAIVAIATQHVGSSLWQRAGIWQDTLNHLSVFGSGIGSFQAEYTLWPRHTNMTLLTASHAYNDFLELAFELGIGVIPLWFMIAFCLENQGPKLPILAFGILSLTYFPLFIPVVVQAFAFSLGHLTRNRSYGTDLEHVYYRPFLR